MINFDHNLRDITLRMLAAHDIQQLMAIMAISISPFGCDFFTFGGSSSGKLASKLQNLGITFFHTNFPAEIMARNPNPLIGNFTVRRALEQGKDSLWTDQSIWQDATPDEIALNDGFKAVGLARGYTGVLSRQPGYYTGISFHLDRMPETDFIRDWDEIRPKLMAIATVFDKVFLNNHMTAHFGLSPRERDVLTSLAAGLRPDQIAEKLGVSAGTIDKYIVNSKNKLSARTRDHAVARALMLGLIDP
jgi:DNA-binding CsgD family transcriptional regulator